MEMVPGSSPGMSHAAPAQLQKDQVESRTAGDSPIHIPHPQGSPRQKLNILTKWIDVAAIANCNLVTENNRNRSGGQKFKTKVGSSIPYALLAFMFLVMEINYSALFLSLPKATLWFDSPSTFWYKIISHWI